MNFNALGAPIRTAPQIIHPDKIRYKKSLKNFVNIYLAFFILLIKTINNPTKIMGTDKNCPIDRPKLPKL